MTTTQQAKQRSRKRPRSPIDIIQTTAVKKARERLDAKDVPGAVQVLEAGALLSDTL